MASVPVLVEQARKAIVTPRFKDDANALNPGEATYGTPEYKERRARNNPYVEHMKFGSRERMLVRLGTVSTTTDATLSKELNISTKLKEVAADLTEH